VFRRERERKQDDKLLINEGRPPTVPVRIPRGSTSAYIGRSVAAVASWPYRGRGHVAMSWPLVADANIATRDRSSDALNSSQDRSVVFKTVPLRVDYAFSVVSLYLGFVYARCLSVCHTFDLYQSSLWAAPRTLVFL